MAKSKVTKQPGASAPKKKERDYGNPLVKTDAPGTDWQKSSGGRHLTFSKFGDTITGEFIRLEKVKGKGKSDILHFRDENGVNMTAFSSWQITRHLEQNDIQPGDMIKIVFTDVVKGKGNRTCKIFDFYFKPKGTAKTPPAGKQKGKR